MGKRIGVALFALLGVAIAARLTAYQLGWAPAPPEPLFGDGSVRVLHSALSRALPVPDASVGLVAYFSEAIAVLWGGAARPQNQRAAVYVYAAIAAGMALGSLGLVILQVFVVHALCSLCLLSAVLSFGLLVPALSEFAAARRDATHAAFASQSG
jgi:hypothetical protein